MKKIILIISVFLILNACKKDKVEEQPYLPFIIPCTLTTDINLAKQYIKGTWIWVQEKRIQRGIGVTYLTPKTEGYNLKMVLKDSTLQTFKNDNLESNYKYKIQLWGEITGTTFPEDNLPVLVFYRLSDGLRETQVPIKICDNYLLQQFQYVSSIGGERIWRKL